MKGRPRSPRRCWCKDTMQSRKAAARDAAAELTASKVEERRRCCSPQIVLANTPRPSTTIARSTAIGTTRRCNHNGSCLSPEEGNLSLKD
ncbi:hypothetical protein CRG98_008311 [Punica granatum]|uniref:Uncharacterized protein n=1 Tax=Punica granatum TaxID=22663 RepID=A0A2I0KS66_PUNGR|nr:hypothetical protein CRG98_008311 [Punica granatum]